MLADRLALEARRLGPETGREIEIVVGVDFGTTSTKIAARFPYLGDGGAMAAPVPVWAQADATPHLRATRLWEDRDGGLTLAPEDGAAPFCALKTRLMHPPGGAAGAAAAEAEAAAFLALLARHTRGWLAPERPRLTGAGRLRWTWRFGFPAAALDGGAMEARYRRVCAAALRLVAGPARPTRADMAAALASRAQTEDRVKIAPELAGAVGAFVNGAPLDRDLYALIDVGGGTVDVCAFNLHETTEGERRLPIFAASVDLLGVEPARLCADDPARGRAFRARLDVLLRGVIWETRRLHYPQSPRWASALPVFLVGGGAPSQTHTLAASSLTPWLRLNRSGRAALHGAAELGGLEHEGGAETRGRLCFAAGLSLALPDIPEVRLRPGRACGGVAARRHRGPRRPRDDPRRPPAPFAPRRPQGRTRGRCDRGAAALTSCEDLVAGVRGCSSIQFSTRLSTSRPATGASPIRAGLRGRPSTAGVRARPMFRSRRSLRGPDSRRWTSPRPRGRACAFCPMCWCAACGSWWGHGAAKGVRMSPMRRAA